MHRALRFFVLASLAAVLAVGGAIAADAAPEKATTEQVTCNAPLSPEAAKAQKEKKEAFELALANLLKPLDKNKRIDQCPATSTCQTAGCSVDLPSCNTWGTSKTSCELPGGGTFDCSGGEHIHVRSCACKNGLGQFCIGDSDVSLFCQ